MVLEDDKVLENRKLRRLENQKVGGFKKCQPSYLPTFSPSCSSLSYFSKYLCLSVICPYPLSSFLFPISGLKVLVIEYLLSNKIIRIIRPVCIQGRSFFQCQPRFPVKQLQTVFLQFFCKQSNFDSHGTGAFTGPAIGTSAGTMVCS